MSQRSDVYKQSSEGNKCHKVDNVDKSWQMPKEGKDFKSLGQGKFWRSIRLDCCFFSQIQKRHLLNGFPWSVDQIVFGSETFQLHFSTLKAVWIYLFYPLFYLIWSVLLWNVLMKVFSLALHWKYYASLGRAGGSLKKFEIYVWNECCILLGNGA